MGKKLIEINFQFETKKKTETKLCQVCRKKIKKEKKNNEKTKKKIKNFQKKSLTMPRIHRCATKCEAFLVSIRRTKKRKNKFKQKRKKPVKFRSSVDLKKE